MAFEILETRELAGVLRNFPPKSSYWLDLCFPRAYFSQSEKIDFDVVDQGRRLAPFVAPNVQGQPMLADKQDIRSFTPAYIKPKDPVDPRRVLLRRAGEAYGGDMTPQQRRDAIVADILVSHRDMIDRRLEWMAAEAIQRGQVTISGENYPTVTVGFGRNAANEKTLTLGARWNQTTATPLTDISNWANEMLTRSGRRLRRVTLSPTASTNFFNNDQVQKSLETRRGSLTRLEGYNVSGENVIVHGQLEGGVELVTYKDFYHDNVGGQVPFMTDGDVVLTGDVDGVRAFGAIMDDDANYQSLQIFQKMFKSDDPSGIFILSQSAPLMIPTVPDASMLIHVNG